MPVINPEDINFNNKNLNFQVRLETCLGSQFIDFTGKKSFVFEMMRKGVGFGITDISIEVNPSLQPIVEITFKDLYGNTVFRPSKRELKDNQNSSNGIQDYGYQALFAWPPPKFLFTFKGYLGSSVTWILNIKKYDINYDPSDNSYDIKVSFVPNQWGFFADLPLLYLLAVKRLRLNDGSIDSQNITSNPSYDKNARFISQKEPQSFFDLIKIGKKVDVSKKETSKEFSNLRNILSGLRSNIASTIAVSKLVRGGETIEGEINGRLIGSFDFDGPGGSSPLSFNPITIPRLEKSIIGLDEQTIKNILSRSEDITRLNKFLILKCRFKDILFSDEAEVVSGVDWETFKKNLNSENPSDIVSNLDGSSEGIDIGDGNEKVPLDNKAQRDSLNRRKNNFSIQVESQYKERINIINRNLTLLDKAIQQSIFEKNKQQISKLTIGEVFSRMSGDAAYIMGKILEAGIRSYEANKLVRNNNDSLIGKYYPMELVEDGSGTGKKEVPARGVGALSEDADSEGGLKTQEAVSGSDSINEKEINFNPRTDSEMAFVEEFIQAVSEGIAENQQVLSQNFNEDTSKLKSRINNLEILRENPYKPSYNSIASNIIERSGIASYVTRSDDPNFPGDYNNFSFDRTSMDRIRKAANSDLQNISDFLILSLSSEERSRLKRFCKFWDRFLTNDARVRNQNVETELEYPYAADGGGATKNSRSKGNFRNALELVDPFGLSRDVSDTKDPLQFNFDYDRPLNNSLKNFRVFLEFDENNEPINSETITVSAFMEEYVIPLLEQNNKEILTSEVGGGLKIREDGSSNEIYVLEKIVNNGIGYIKGPKKNYFYAIMFEGDDALRVLEKANSFPSSSVFGGSQEDAAENSLFFIDGSLEGIVSIESFLNEEGDDVNPIVTLANKYIDEERVFNYKEIERLSGGDFGEANFETLKWDKKIVQFPRNPNEISADGLAIALFQQTEDLEEAPARSYVWAPLIGSYGTFGNIIRDGGGNDQFLSGRNQRIFLKEICSSLLKKIDRLEQERREILGSILGRFEDQKNIVYKQFHHLFNQWSALSVIGNNREDLCQPVLDDGGEPLSIKLKEQYSNITDIRNSEDEKRIEENGAFRFDYPLNSVNNSQGSSGVKVSNSIIDIEPLYRLNASTTVLNAIQQVCTKNNFIFIPIAGNANYKNIEDVYKVYKNENDSTIGNYFHVLFAPTPEKRLLNDRGNTINNTNSFNENFATNAIGVEFGSPENNIIKSLNVGTSDNKVTAESIVNLQRIVDNENENKTVLTDCSVLSVMQGRSYKAKIQTLGNAQIYPMQYFFIRKNPLFGGLYQIMKVRHTIRANDFETEYEGIKLLQTDSGYGGTEPITLESLEKIKVLEETRSLTAQQIRDLTTKGLDFLGAEGQLRQSIEEVVDKYVSAYGTDDNPESNSLVIPDGSNGRLNTNDLTTSQALLGNFKDTFTIISGSQTKLVDSAAKSLDRMIRAFSRAKFKGKQKITFTSGYRSIEAQEEARRKHGTGAGKPGTSIHGLGLAVDMFWGVRTQMRSHIDKRPSAFKHPNYRWFFENAHKYGWYNPESLRDNFAVDEWWHWEYRGLRGEPSPLKEVYQGDFDFERDVEIIRSFKDKDDNFGTFIK